MPRSCAKLEILWVIAKDERISKFMITLLFLMQTAGSAEGEWGKYRRCMVQQAELYSSLDEPAETIVTAALASCREQRISARSSILSKFVRYPELKQEVEATTEKFEADIRETTVKAVLDKRLGRLSK